MSQLFFKKRYQDAIRSGQKHTTIRRWNRPMVRPESKAYSPGLGWLAIDSVDAIELESLGDEDARSDGFQTADEMRALLRTLYPQHASDGKRWFRVRFRLSAEPPPRFEEAPAPSGRP